VQVAAESPNFKLQAGVTRWYPLFSSGHLMRTEWKRLHALALAEVEATLGALPAPLRDRAEKLPVTFERRPNAAQRRDGIAPDTLGLFVGTELAWEGASASPLPAQIILFLENIWEQAEGEEEVFGEEVHTTFLHELGHYLGLDEEDLFERGLE
jgi:predicted Zn-dependent protease with MMP-like domain